MSVTAFIFNKTANIFFKRESRAFFAPNMNLRMLQEKKLSAYLKKNSKSLFGKKYGFSNICDYKEYSKRVPILDYSFFQTYIQKIKEGEKNVLTCQPVKLLEPTSGTSGGTKLIPYTADLQAEYMAAVKPWLADLYRNRPGLMGGSAYWSISPVVDFPMDKESLVPVGYEDDSGYFGALSPLIKKIFPVPSIIKRIRSIENFRFITGLFLALSPDLRLFSVWNPSFLTILLESLKMNQDRIVRSITDNRLYWPEKEDSVPRLPIPCWHPSVKRIEQAFDKQNWALALWPKLSLVSCWTQGQSSLNLEALKNRLPGVEIQGKGLLATEGIVSFPVFEAGGSVLAAHSHFFEFDCTGDSVRPAWELEQGLEAKVIMTTGGGLYRYDLGDRVRVEAFYKGLPVLKFLGRDRVCDLTGEKLSEIFVTQALNELNVFKKCAFAIVAPVREGQSFRYLFIVEGLDSSSGERAAAILEKVFLRNFHYAYSRGLNQLLALKYIPAGTHAMKRFLDFLAAKGTKSGAVKAVGLYSFTDIADCFDLGAKA